MIDTHCHLYDSRYIEDLDVVIERAKHVGISKMIIPGCNHKTNIKALLLAKQYDFIYVALGWHPLDSDAFNQESEQFLIEHLKHEKVVAIGEIGLDYYHHKQLRNKQQTVLKKQLRLADKLQLPVIIHSRDATDDTLQILKEFPNVFGVMHCYGGSVKMVSKFIEHGYYISLAGPVTFKNGHIPKEIAEVVPLDKLLIETDAPYLTPHPYRGKRNEPSYVKLIAEKIATIKNCEIEIVIKQTTENANSLFKFM